jgi:hypothetical protein
MKLLLDENLPHQLRHEILGHDCSTVAFMGWRGVENGELLRPALAAGFDGVLTKTPTSNTSRISSIFQSRSWFSMQPQTTSMTSGR